MSRSPSGYGRGRSRIASIAEKTALFAPIPRASVRMTTIEKDGDLRLKRTAPSKFLPAPPPTATPPTPPNPPLPPPPTPPPLPAPPLPPPHPHPRHQPPP